MTRVLAAGDHFVRPDLISTKVRPVAPDAEITEMLLPWPLEPFGDIAEVAEASGSEDAMIASLEGVDACLTQMAPLTERVLAASTRLRFVAIGRGGPVNVNLEAATRQGITVCYAPGRNAVATAEHTVALMLAAARQIPLTHAELVGGVWRSDHYVYDQVGPELAGSVVGVVGFGAIGSRVASIVAGFGADVLIADPLVTEVPLGTVVALEELMRRSDFVTIHARASRDNAGLISRNLISLMPRGAVLVNCARGSLVDYDAVCDALVAGRLHAAGFDVYPEEPVPADSRLLRTPRLVMTPHLAGASKQTAHQAASIMAEELRRYLSGEPVRYRANPA